MVGCRDQISDFIIVINTTNARHIIIVEEANFLILTLAPDDSEQYRSRVIQLIEAWCTEARAVTCVGSEIFCQTVTVSQIVGIV